MILILISSSNHLFQRNCRRGTKICTMLPSFLLCLCVSVVSALQVKIQYMPHTEYTDVTITVSGMKVHELILTLTGRDIRMEDDRAATIDRDTDDEPIFVGDYSFNLVNAAEKIKITLSQGNNKYVVVGRSMGENFEALGEASWYP